VDPGKAFLSTEDVLLLRKVRDVGIGSPKDSSSESILTEDEKTKI
jgi:hypothetical protein